MWIALGATRCQASLTNYRYVCTYILTIIHIDIYPYLCIYFKIQSLYTQVTPIINCALIEQLIGRVTNVTRFLYGIVFVYRSMLKIDKSFGRPRNLLHLGAVGPNNMRYCFAPIWISRSNKDKQGRVFNQ